MARTQVVLASTLYGVATVAAAVDDGRFAPFDRRLLVITNNTGTPELSRAADHQPGFASLATRFDTVVSYNETIAPLHPAGWAPRPAERPLWERHLRQTWGLGDDEITLLVESIQVEPARAVAAIFGEADIDVYADGLMSYGPTRNRLEASIGSRIGRLLYVDLVPGLTPILLSEWGVHPVPISSERVRAVTAAAAEVVSIGDLGDEPVAIMLGQYLSALSILTVEEEAQLQLTMLEALVRRGERNILFKPHPSAPLMLTDRLRDYAGRHGIRFSVLEHQVLAETLYERLPVTVVASCFSTGLMTASTLYGLPVIAVGTELVLGRLRPYQNSNRVPLMIIDQLIVRSESAERPAPHPLLGDLLASVGFAMQPSLHPERRAATHAFLELHYPTFAHYFRRRRLTNLGLPGRLPHRSPSTRRRLRRLARAGLRRLGLTRIGPLRSLSERAQLAREDSPADRRRDRVRAGQTIG